jgi:phytoene/squalene synthetase
MIAVDDLSSWIVPFREQDPRLALAIRFMPPEFRQDVETLFAFRHELLRASAKVSDPMVAEIRLQWWCDALSGAREDEANAHPLARAVLSLISNYNLRSASLVTMIEAIIFELYDDPVPTVEQLYALLGETHATLFRASERIVAQPISVTDETRASHAGLALGFARLALDHRIDPERVRKMTTLSFASLSDEAVLEELIRLSRYHLAEAYHYLIDVPKVCRLAYLPLVGLGSALDDIQSQDSTTRSNRAFSIKPTLVFKLWYAAVTGNI